ncbi:hypothetical protein [Actinomadura sp. HBU206391]|uniref:hypothetical protein n=1 Tax=Actinomadura sp. HBU206391 TaxID=2731692 RepID=UPI00164FCF94|nr:hypothetical protein [Actinomadura sp. HBU206391]MBC6459836.1 hypothetical protein [Actinomadura sp. HBU206391]
MTDATDPEGDGKPPRAPSTTRLSARALALAGVGLAVAGLALPWLSERGYEVSTGADRNLVHGYEDLFLAMVGLLLAWCVGTAAVSAWTGTRLDWQVPLLMVTAVAAARLQGLIEIGSLYAPGWDVGLDLLSGACVMVVLAAGSASAARRRPVAEPPPGSTSPRPLSAPGEAAAGVRRVLARSPATLSDVVVACVIAVLYAAAQYLLDTVVSVLMLVVAAAFAARAQPLPGPPRSAPPRPLSVFADMSVVVAAGCVLACVPTLLFIAVPLCALAVPWVVAADLGGEGPQGRRGSWERITLVIVLAIVSVSIVIPAAPVLHLGQLAVPAIAALVFLVGFVAMAWRLRAVSGSGRRTRSRPRLTPAGIVVEVAAGLAAAAGAGLLIASAWRPWGRWVAWAGPGERPDVDFAHFHDMYPLLTVPAMLMLGAAVAVYVIEVAVRGRAVPAGVAFLALFGTVLGTAAIPMSTTLSFGSDRGEFHRLGGADLLVGSLSALVVAFVISRLGHRLRHPAPAVGAAPRHHDRAPLPRPRSDGWDRGAAGGEPARTGGMTRPSVPVGGGNGFSAAAAVAQMLALAGLGLAMIGMVLPWYTLQRRERPAGPGDIRRTEVHLYVHDDVFLAAMALLLACCLGMAAVAAFRATGLDWQVALLMCAAVIAARLHLMFGYDDRAESPWELGLDLLTGAVVLLTIAAGLASRPQSSPGHDGRTGATSPGSTAKVVGVVAAVTGLCVVGRSPTGSLQLMYLSLVVSLFAVPIGVVMAVRAARTRTPTAPPGPARTPVAKVSGVMAAVATLIAGGFLLGSLVTPWYARNKTVGFPRDPSSPDAYFYAANGPFGLISVLLVGTALAVHVIEVYVRGRRAPLGAIWLALLGPVVGETAGFFYVGSGGDVLSPLAGRDVLTGSLMALIAAFVISRLGTAYSAGRGSSGVHEPARPQP